MSPKSINFRPYIHRVLKQIHPESGLSGSALSTLNNMVKIIIEKIMTSVNQLVLRTGKKTISAKYVQSASKLILKGEIEKHAITEATNAMAKYHSLKSSRKEEKETKSIEKMSPVSRSSMAGLSLPISRVQNMMVELSTSTRKSDTAAVFLTAVCEYLLLKVLELSGNVARDSKRIRITPRHIMIAVRNDEDLNNLYKDTIFAGGVVPHIDSAILSKGKK